VIVIVAGLDCVDARCRQPCFEDANCLGGQVCQDRYCIDPAELSPECAMSAECPTGECVNAQCQ